MKATKSFQGVKAIRAYGLFGGETLGSVPGFGARFERFEPDSASEFLGAAVIAHQFLEFAHSDNAISTDPRGKP